ncbi:MAG: hypothetical protein R3263_02625, partial [Myxococcota bacterium]|nr:hypothetical protein [Myxococcota bacterium]
VIVRLLNPTDAPRDATVRLGFDVESARAVRLDEAPAADDVLLDGRRTLRLLLPPHALRSVRLTGAL